jgi:hypothetical protein
MTFFLKDNASHKLNIQQPGFSIFKGVAPHQRTREEEDNFNKFAAMLEVADVTLPSKESMEVEESYRNFKAEMRDLKHDWKELMKEPVRSVSAQLKDGWKNSPMGVVEESELFPFEVKTVVKDGALMAYFVERLEDRLVQFNCHTGVRESLVCIHSHILTIAISEHILAVLENKLTGKKMVAQIANESFDDGEIEVSRNFSRMEGELDINCSMRGLNSLVVDKNKLMIFD